MLLRLLVLFITLPLIELFLLLYLAELTDWRVPLGLVIGTGVLGALLAKTQGLLTYSRIRRELMSGRLPGTALVDAVMILFASGLLLTPGLLTDIFGFSLLIPTCRACYRRWLVKKFKASFTVQTFPRAPADTPTDESEVIDSYVIHKEERPGSGDSAQ